MDWKERLQQNLVDYQSIPFWSWNDKLEPEELRRQIRAIKKPVLADSSCTRAVA